MTSDPTPDDNRSRSAASADLGPTELLTLAGETLLQRRLMEVEELQILGAWADLHGADGPGGLLELGGEGTPGVRDYAMGEIALARSAGVVSTMNATADILDLRHRLPLTWEKTQAGATDVWVVRKICRLTRHLPLARMWVVDQAVAAALGHQAPPRILALAEGKVIEADPDLHNQRRAEEAHRRYARLGPCDEHGYRTFIARLDSGDAAWLDATLSRVTEILTPRYDQHCTTDEIRAHALALLARPAELFTLLLEHTDHPDTDTSSTDRAGTDEAPADPAGPTDGPADGAGPSRALAFPADLLDRLREVNWRVLAPRHTLYIHLHQQVLDGTTEGAARIEGLPAASLTQLHGLLAGAHVTVKPVIDLNQHVHTNAYEHPETLKERVHLIHGGDYWPYAPSTSRRLDYDHVTPYDNNGPDAQTGTHNSAPIARRHHRYRTHAGYQVRRHGPNRYLWTTPAGQHFLVDHHGTHRIDDAIADTIINAPPGLDIHPNPPATTFAININSPRPG